MKVQPDPPAAVDAPIAFEPALVHPRRRTTEQGRWAKTR
jgi:hypothetical protein